jgi:hypothetical protein
MNTNLKPPGSKDGLFKIIVITALVILFALIFYVMFGPLPNQSNFVTKGGNNSNTFNQITVVGTSTLDGDVTMKQDVGIENDLNVDGEANLRKANFLTTTSGIDTLQGIIEPTVTGSLDIKGNNFITFKNISGTNTLLSFNTSTQDGAIYGNLNINDPNGSSGLTLVNQTLSNFRYKFINDPSTNDLLIKSTNSSGSIIKTLADFTQDGAQVNLLDSTVAAPKVYVNGTGGAGQVYDTVYNIPPTLTTTPTFTTLTVTGATTLQGATTLEAAVTAEDDITAEGDIIVSTDTKDIVFTARATGYNALKFAGERTVGSDFYMHQIMGESSTNALVGGSTYIQAPTKVTITNSNGNGGDASFDVRPNFVSGTKTDNYRDTFTEPFVNFANGYMKFTLPPYTTSLVTGNQINSFTYNTTTASGSTADSDYGQGSILGGWSSIQPGANGRIITPTGAGGIGNSFWACPKKGIWSINFSSNFEFGVSSSFYLCSTTVTNIPALPPYSPSPFTTSTTKLIGLDFVNTFVVLDTTDRIFVTLAAGNGALRSGSPPRLELNLIMELN